jgi:flavin reductase (DIM6/NTAB) family NADH-FMN oxidoreductase RutF
MSDMTDTSSFVVPHHAIVLAVSMGNDGRPNLMPLEHSDPQQPPGTIWLGIRHACYSNRLIKECGCFVAAFPSEDFLYETDRAGCKTGRDKDKFARDNIETKPGEVVTAPLIARCRLNLECELAEVVQISDIRDRFVGRIVRIHVWPECANETGEPDLDKCRPVVQKEGAYWSWNFGKRLQKFYYTSDPIRPPADAPPHPRT